MMNRRDLLRGAGWVAGGVLVAPAMLSLLQSCQQASRATFEPKYFTAEEAAFVSAFVDTLLPRTDTPGGLDVKVDLFIDKVMAGTTSKGDAPSEMQKGIRAMNEAAQKQYGKAFAELNESERGAIFAAAEKRSPKYNPQVWGTAVGEEPPIDFYRSFKSMVLWGYLSSETIAKDVLNYDPIPGKYDGDIPLDSVGGRAWSL